ncbi:hypothetical protein WL99_31765 [Burkholderia cepacia]|nr:hypothetical protein WL99_31765 [Burkholderia cepacia]
MTCTRPLDRIGAHRRAQAFVARRGSERSIQRANELAEALAHEMIDVTCTNSATACKSTAKGIPARRGERRTYAQGVTGVKSMMGLPIGLLG